ncbi:MAG: DUF2490 domain-containing protein [Burkholderiales bacterium]|nr:DUF2490 domain-containing protein [Burkholderiales bacterium]
MATILRNYVLHFLALLACAVLVAPARAEERQREFVPELNAYASFSDRTRLFLLADLTRNLTADTSESEFGAHLDYTLKPYFRPELRDANWERNRYFWTRIGYLQLGTPDKARTGPTERRVILELTGRMPLAQEVWLVHRGRVDLRDIGGESSQRYRYRLGIEREIKMGGIVTVPYAQAEFFYDTRYDSWNRQLYQAGAEIELSKRWRIEPYLAVQNDNRSTSGNVNRAGLVLKYYR